MGRIPFWHPPLSGSLMNWGGKVQTKVVLRRPSTRQKQKVVYSTVRRLYIKDWVKYQLFCAWHENTIFGGIFVDNKSTTSLLFSKAEDFSTMKNILAPASNWQITNSCIRRVFKNPNFNLTPIIMPTSGLCVVLHVLQNEE